jgi:hypothetical protein
MSLHPLPAGKQRHRASPGTSPIAEATTRRSAAAAPDALYAGQPFRTVLRRLGLTSNRVFGLARTDQEWSQELEATLTATRREDLDLGTNAAYIHGCVCSECRTYQLVRMGRNRN